MIVIVMVPMKTRAFVLRLILAISPVLAYPQLQAESPRPASILVKAGKLLDVRKASYIDGAAIWIEGERIKEVGPASEVQAHASKNAEIVDLSRATVLPGLIDCHTHLMARVADLLAPDSYLLNLA